MVQEHRRVEVFVFLSSYALSATCTKKMLRKVTDALLMTGCKNFISKNPNK
jgi:hypothetical protein